jgi:hexosaminidase
VSVPTATVSELFSRGYTALPYPREVNLLGGELTLDADWTIATEGKLDPAAEASLQDGLRRLLGRPLALKTTPGAQSISLSIQAAAVASEAPEGIARQAYRLSVGTDRVAIMANAPAGLYYGVQTLLQLLRPTGAGACLRLPIGTLEDWPDRQLRIIHYDTKHHQDRLESVKHMITRASAFKINAVAWEIEDKFAYQQHPIIGAPDAFTPDQMREITAHALQHHVEIIPILQGPSHLAFVLKHQQFAQLREDPDNNYMLCPSNEKSYDLLFSLYDELLAATPGCSYFHVGTDEPYFLGDGTECGCRARRDAIGAGGMMAEFIERCAGYLMDKGRKVICWGEWPMRAVDVPRLPSGIINAVYQNDEMSAAYAKQEIRELIYSPVQGSRPLFPEYFHSPDSQGKRPARLDSISETIRRGPCRPFDPLGVLMAAWDDSGLHMETFWLGWVLGCAWGWNPGLPPKEEAIAQFCGLFHGPVAVRMPAVYRGLDSLARFWTNAWDPAPSKRGPSYKRQWHPRFDRTIALPHLPNPENLDNRPFFKRSYAQLLADAAEAKLLLGRVQDILMENMGRTDRNRYALEVFLSLCALFGDFIAMLELLAELESRLDAAREDVGNVNFQRAALTLEAAAGLARRYVADREVTMKELTATWEKGRCPKGCAVNGRDFLHIQDDTKNHGADWTPDLGYLLKPSRDLDIGGWADHLQQVAADFRKQHPEHGKGWRPGEGFEEDG